MGKSIILPEKSRGYSFQDVDKIKIKSTSGENTIWIPQDTVELGTLHVNKNGVYNPSSDGVYGYSDVSVNCMPYKDGGISESIPFEVVTAGIEKKYRTDIFATYYDESQHINIMPYRYSNNSFNYANTSFSNVTIYSAFPLYIREMAFSEHDEDYHYHDKWWDFPELDHMNWYDILGYDANIPVGHPIEIGDLFTVLWSSSGYYSETEYDPSTGDQVGSLKSRLGLQYCVGDGTERKCRYYNDNTYKNKYLSLYKDVDDRLLMVDGAVNTKKGEYLITTLDTTGVAAEGKRQPGVIMLKYTFFGPGPTIVGLRNRRTMNEMYNYQPLGNYETYYTESWGGNFCCLLNKFNYAYSDVISGIWKKSGSASGDTIFPKVNYDGKKDNKFENVEQWVSFCEQLENEIITR